MKTFLKALSLSNGRLLLLLAAAALAADLHAGAVAGTIDFIVLNKEQDFNQTGPSTVTPDATQPFVFSVELSGSNESAIFPAPPNRITSLPVGSSAIAPSVFPPPTCSMISGVSSSRSPARERWMPPSPTVPIRSSSAARPSI